MTAVFLAPSGSSPRSSSCRAGSRSSTARRPRCRGYQILPLLGGLIFSAVASGQIVGRTGRYRLLIFGALVAMAVGLFMLTHLRADTPLPVLWAWMFMTGLGVGPTFAVFPLVVQNNVPVRQIGTATSNLTFFQQVGGTVGLALTGTIFARRWPTSCRASSASAGVPPAGRGALAAAAASTG